ncbi:MAG: DMT family transporter [Actinomycetota bacterium]|nr:DMT family transporter [Actinomycetota bacterium]
MFVVFTPLLAGVVLRRRVAAAAWTGVVLAAAGLALLSVTASFVPRDGDALVLVCALAFALHIVGLGVWSLRHDPVALTTVQLLTAGVAHSGVALVAELGGAPARWDAGAAAVVLLTALVASAAAFWVQTAAQRVIAPTRTAVILTMEPVFAGLFGFLLLGERLTGRGWLGCALILAAMLVVELRPGVRHQPHGGGGGQARSW